MPGCIGNGKHNWIYVADNIILSDDQIQMSHNIYWKIIRIMSGHGQGIYAQWKIITKTLCWNCNVILGQCILYLITDIKCDCWQQIK